MANRVDHVSFTVADLDRSIPFYRDLLGFKLNHVVEREDLPSYDALLGYSNIRLRIASFALPASDITLELMQFRHPRPATRGQDLLFVGTPHLAYLVDDLNAEFIRLRSLGGRFLSGVTEIHREGRYVGKAVFLLDPDDILIEPMEVSKGDTK